MQCNQHGLKATLKKLWPSIVVLSLGALAGFTNTLGSTIREAVHKAVTDFTSGLTPYIVNFIILVVALNVAYVLYHPVCHWLHKLLHKTKMTERGKDVSYKIARPFYWLIVLYVVLTLFAPDIMGKMTLGIGLFGAAIAVALKDTAADLLAWVRMEFWQSLKVGDEVQVIGLADVKGRVIEIDYFQTRIETATAIDSIANRDLQAKGVRHFKAPVSPPAEPTQVQS